MDELCKYLNKMYKKTDTFGRPDIRETMKVSIPNATYEEQMKFLNECKKEVERKDYILQNLKK